jgi:hypothetical protein
LCCHLPYELVLLAWREFERFEVLSSSAEYFHFEDVEDDIAEDGQSGVMGGGFVSSSLLSRSLMGAAAPEASLLGPL